MRQLSVSFSNQKNKKYFKKSAFRNHLNIFSSLFSRNRVHPLYALKYKGDFLVTLEITWFVTVMISSNGSNLNSNTCWFLKSLLVCISWIMRYSQQLQKDKASLYVLFTDKLMKKTNEKISELTMDDRDANKTGCLDVTERILASFIMSV